MRIIIFILFFYLFRYQQFLRRNLICLSSVAGLDTNLDVLLPVCIQIYKVKYLLILKL